MFRSHYCILSLLLSFNVFAFECEQKVSVGHYIEGSLGSIKQYFSPPGSCTSESCEKVNRLVYERLVDEDHSIDNSLSVRSYDFQRIEFRAIDELGKKKLIKLNQLFNGKKENLLLSELILNVKYTVLKGELLEVVLKRPQYSLYELFKLVYLNDIEILATYESNKTTGLGWKLLKLEENEKYHYFELKKESSKGCDNHLQVYWSNDAEFLVRSFKEQVISVVENPSQKLSEKLLKLNAEKVIGQDYFRVILQGKFLKDSRENHQLIERVSQNFYLKGNLSKFVDEPSYRVAKHKTGNPKLYSSEYKVYVLSGSLAGVDTDKFIAHLKASFKASGLLNITIDSSWQQNTHYDGYVSAIINPTGNELFLQEMLYRCRKSFNLTIKGVFNHVDFCSKEAEALFEQVEHDGDYSKIEELNKLLNEISPFKPLFSKRFVTWVNSSRSKKKLADRSGISPYSVYFNE